MLDAVQPKGGIILVSAYFKPWHRLDVAIRNALARGARVFLIVRGGDRDGDKQLEAAQPYVPLGARVEVLDRLHAKMVLTPEHFMLTSMNLHSSSDQNSWEVAARFDRSDEEAWAQRAELIASLNAQLQSERQRREYEQVRPTAASRRRAAKLQGSRQPAVGAAAAPRQPAAAGTGFASHLGRILGTAAAEFMHHRSSQTTGHCIRCGDEIAFDPDKPHCAACYRRWARYRDPRYSEKVCHACGSRAKTSQLKPLCRPCYKASA